MQIKEINVARYALGFLPNETELQKLNDDFRGSLKFHREHAGGSVIPRTNRINCRSVAEKNIFYPKYEMSVAFSPSLPLDRKLVDEVIKRANGVTKLNFQVNHDSITVVPAGLRFLTGEWQYNVEQSHVGIESHDHFVARISFIGNPPTHHIKQLREIADVVYSPRIVDDKLRGKQAIDDSETVFMFGSGLGGRADYPHCGVVKTFRGDISRNAEKDLERFYTDVKKYILESGICEGCMDLEGKVTLADSLKKDGINLHEEISQASIGRQTKYTPLIAVAAYIPAQRVHVTKSASFSP